MSDIDLEIDGKKVSAEAGQMVIEAADEAGIYIPRFCYHKHLSVAANCRMCLVEVEKSAKALPACATPVSAGMRVFTRSPGALSAQKAVMEFLLINHPLDCPICDQGGECELQDLSLGFGADASFFSEGKRAVKDQNLGSLVATEMTRCIHCTRCVRFGDEVAGQPELGAIERGENMKIHASIKQTLQSELSGNIIDLCPVGALTSKPFRFKARAWELTQRPSIAPHDCVGSNLNIHTRSGEVMRVVPRENPSINETWLSDRDRFSYEALSHSDRLTKPIVKTPQGWQEVEWPVALEIAAKLLQDVVDNHGGEQLGALISPNATLEEFYLLQKLCRSLGSSNIDHRLREINFSDQETMPLYPGLNSSIEDIEKNDVVFLVGTNIIHEQPLLATRIRKAVKSGAEVIVVNMVNYDFNFNVDLKRIVPPHDLSFTLASIASLMVPDSDLFANITPRDADLVLAEVLRKGKNVGVYIGAQAFNHPEAALIRTLTQQIADACGTKAGWLTEGANAAGAWLAGAVPHRGPGGASLENSGLSVVDIIENPRAAYLLCNVEPSLDCAEADRVKQSLHSAKAVVALSCFRDPELLDVANVILPQTPFTETAGTFVNLEGKWQSFNGVANPLGEARPGWKVLRVLGNLLEVDDCDYSSAADIATELQSIIKKTNFKLGTAAHYKQQIAKIDYHQNTNLAAQCVSRIGEVPIYAGDSLVRRAASLQSVQDQLDGFFRGIVIHPLTASDLNIIFEDEVLVKQGDNQVTLPVRLDEKISRQSALICAGIPETVALCELFGTIEIQKV